MAGLARICKMYGRIDATDENGKKVVWLWDYAQGKPRLQSEMTKDEIAASEKAKWEAVKALQFEGSTTTPPDKITLTVRK